jgi:DNA-binding Lrp family transcriptional regulator
MYKLDLIDKEILQILQQNAKMNIKQIAFKVGLSATPVYERIKRLEKKGIISHYAAIIDKEKIGLELTVFCQVSLRTHVKNHIKGFQNAILEMDEVLESYHVAGDFDYLLKIVVHDSKIYHRFLVDKLSNLDMVSKVQSNFVMFKTKESDYYKL